MRSRPERDGMGRLEHRPGPAVSGHVWLRIDIQHSICPAGVLFFCHAVVGFRCPPQHPSYFRSCPPSPRPSSPPKLGKTPVSPAPSLCFLSGHAFAACVKPAFPSFCLPAWLCKKTTRAFPLAFGFSLVANMPTVTFSLCGIVGSEQVSDLRFYGLLALHV